MSDKELTIKQSLFIAEYLINGFNATKAAITAGYSEKTAYSQGQRLLKDVEVRLYIDKSINEALDGKKEELKKRIIDEYSAIAFADITNDISIVTKELEEEGIVNKYQTVEFKDTADTNNKKAVAGIKISDKGSIEVKYYDKKAALDSLAKYADMFTDKLELSGSGDKPLTVQMITLSDVVNASKPKS